MGIIFRYNEKCVNNYTEHYRFYDSDFLFISSNYCDKTGSNSSSCNAAFLHERIYYVLSFLHNILSLFLHPNFCFRR